MTPFFEAPPQLQNQFSGDLALQSCLRRLLPPDVLAEITSGLESLGDIVASKMLAI